MWKSSLNHKNIILGKFSVSSPQINFQDFTLISSVYCSIIFFYHLPWRRHFLRSDYSSHGDCFHLSLALLWGRTHIIRTWGDMCIWIHISSREIEKLYKLILSCQIYICDARVFFLGKIYSHFDLVFILLKYSALPVIYACNKGMDFYILFFA